MNEGIPTYEVYQNEVEDNDIDFMVSKHQPYFEFEINGEKCLIGLDKILECLIIAEKIDEIPKLGNGFWVSVKEKFGVNYFEYFINQSPE